MLKNYTLLISKYICVQILLLMVFFRLANGQGTTIIAPPPNAAAITSYNEIPVGLYTGKADISFDLLKLDAGEFNLPVSLQYDPALLRVSGYASRVGLGWILNCGGVITRSIVGLADELGNGGFNRTYANLPPDDPRPIRPLTNLIRTIRDGGSDSEPDIYSYSLLQGGGSFVNTGERYLSQNNPGVKIEKITGTGAILKFKITDEKGYQYFFEDIERTDYSIATRSGSAPTAWNVSKIVTPNKTDSLLFFYDSFNYQFAADYSETIYDQKNPGRGLPPSYQNQSQIIMGSILSSVKSSLGTLKFYYSGRFDCEDKKIDQVVLLDLTEQQVLKKVTFNYDYFSQSGANTKLRLLSYTIGDQNNAEMLYRFSYTSDLFPVNNSKAQDHWGFYNGKENNSWIPSHFTNSGAYFYGADKGTNALAIQNGLLKNIKYPTGGFTEFEFEPNEYSSTLLGGAPDGGDYTLIDVNESLSGKNSLSRKVEKDIIVDFQQAATITYRIGNCRNGDAGGACASPGALPPSTTIKLMNGTYVVAVFTSNQSNQIKTGYITQKLDPGTYKLVIETPEPFDFGSMQVVYKKYDTSNPVKKWFGGGIRIKSIIHGDGVNSDKNIIKTYDYSDRTDPGKTTGTLINKPRYSYAYTEYGSSSGGAPAPSCIDPVSYTVWSSFPGNISAVSGGSYVFYPEATERTSGNGEIRYEYEMSNSYQQVNVPPFRVMKKSWKENLISRKAYYDNSLQMLKEEKFEYLFDNINNIPAVRAVRVGPAVNCPVDLVNSDGEFRINSVYFDSYLIPFEQLKQKNETLVEYNGGTTITSTQKRWFEDAYANLTKEESVDSRGNIDRMIYNYAASFAELDPVYAQMKMKNMISVPIEKKKYKGDALVMSEKFNFSLWHDDSKVAVSSIQKSYGSLPLEDELIITEYDLRGNIAEQQRPKGIKEVYLWGYNSKYPVAKIIGSTYSSVTALINQSSLDKPANESALRNYLNTTLRPGLPGSFISVFTYKPLVGMTSSTDEKGKTTYYNYDSMGRLITVRDQDQNIITTNTYHYRN